MIAIMIDGPTQLLLVIVFYLHYRLVKMWVIHFEILLLLYAKHFCWVTY